METCKLAASQEYDYVWVDTCCIDKSSSAELTEAINSMYDWYAGSRKCFVYLGDFDLSKCNNSTPQADFLSSRWFSRGWTLQELIAPSAVEFYDLSWKQYGSKATLCKDIAYATGIDERVLRYAGAGFQDLLAPFTVCQKMSWASNRETRRPEDIAYCLLGIFRVNMPLIYGEGSKAFIRLQQEIIKSTNDLTIFAWRYQTSGWLLDQVGILAESPKCFSGSKDIVLSQDLVYNPDFSITNKGLRITVALQRDSPYKDPIMSLNCHYRDKPHEHLGIFLKVVEKDFYSRVSPRVITCAGRGPLSPSASIFLNLGAKTWKSQYGNKVGVAYKGRNFNVKYAYPHGVKNPFHVLSSYPENRWDEGFGFCARDTLIFVGINIYEVYWQDEVLKFVLACGFEARARPWACIDVEESELWCAAARCDYFRAGEIAQKQRREEIDFGSKMYLNVTLDPISWHGDWLQIDWIQLELRAGREKFDRVQHIAPLPRDFDIRPGRRLSDLFPEPEPTG
ncbi:heterokaryon incompatibility protein-domain-containing protein [Nemania abortiva]|nr:heterokaryon incompatibility protein-domain-containing protein [Nemania abortiva]